MELSPEEKRRIYEEEKARIEARARIERERQDATRETATGLEPNVAALLCYLGGWITGLIFYVLEQQNRRVRFHAAQSLVTFGAITVAVIVLGLIPFIGDALATIAGIISFILWIVLMVKAYSGELYKLAWAGDIAEKMAASTAAPPESQEAPPAAATAEPTTTAEPVTTAEPATTPEPAAPPEPPAAPEPRASAPIDLGRQIERKIDEYFRDKRAGRITASAFTIAWCVFLLVLFNFFNEFIAYYHAETFGNVVTWTREPFFTGDIALWLPILNTTLALAIAGHIFLIIFDRYILREIIRLVIEVFSLATVVVLLMVFPFDFGMLRGTIAASVEAGVTIALICISVGIGIGIIVRLIKLIVNLARGITSYRP